MTINSTISTGTSTNKQTKTKDSKGAGLATSRPRDEDKSSSYGELAGQRQPSQAKLEPSQPEPAQPKSQKKKPKKTEQLSQALKWKQPHPHPHPPLYLTTTTKKAGTITNRPQKRENNKDIIVARIRLNQRHKGGQNPKPRKEKKIRNKRRKGSQFGAPQRSCPWQTASSVARRSIRATTF